MTRLEEAGPNDRILAAFYGLVLRSQGYSPDEAAVLVVQRYPGARKSLKTLRQRRPEPSPTETLKARAATP